MTGRRIRAALKMGIVGGSIIAASAACTPRPPQPVDGLLGGGAGGQGCVRTWNNAHTSTFYVC